MMLSQPPCKGCTGRYINCHSTCCSFVEWKKKDDEAKATIKAKQNIENGFTECSVNSYFKHVVKRKKVRTVGCNII